MQFLVLTFITRRPPQTQLVAERHLPQVAPSLFHGVGTVNIIRRGTFIVVGTPQLLAFLVPKY